MRGPAAARDAKNTTDGVRTRSACKLVLVEDLPRYFIDSCLRDVVAGTLRSIVACIPKSVSPDNRTHFYVGSSSAVHHHIVPAASRAERGYLAAPPSWNGPGSDLQPVRRSMPPLFAPVHLAMNGVAISPQSTSPGGTTGFTETRVNSRTVQPIVVVNRSLQLLFSTAWVNRSVQTSTKSAPTIELRVVGKCSCMFT